MRNDYSVHFKSYKVASPFKVRRSRFRLVSKQSNIITTNEIISDVFKSSNKHSLCVRAVICHPSPHLLYAPVLSINGAYCWQICPAPRDTNYNVNVNDL